MTTLARTRAETALIESFERIAPSLPGGEDVARLRRTAIDRFASTGLPHRRIEAWKYTDLRTSLKEALPPAAAQHPEVAASELAPALGPLTQLDAHWIVFVDGIFAPALSSHGGGAGSTASTLQVFAASQTSVPHWLAGAGSALDALNSAFATDGVVIRASGVAGSASTGASRQQPKPILAIFIHTGRQGQRVTTRNLIHAGSESLTVIEAHVRLGSAPVQSSTSTELVVGPGGHVDHIKLALEGSDCAHLAKLDIAIAADAKVQSFQFTAGSGLARNETHVTFSGSDAKLDISGVFLGRGNDHIDTTFVIDHSTPGCASRELFKGVLDGRAKGVFQGKVIVRPEAQKTDGKQMAKVLMLSEDAEFDSKPELKIYADDVACGHGTTAAEIDPSMVFYLRSRGIPLAEARAMLIESFVGEAIEKVENEAIRAALMEIAVKWLRS
jgi:Fe-S cluster assembly protein SufD